MEQLTVGKKTNQDLAKWFGVKANTFGNQKKKRLEELKDFAEFHMDGCKVVIDRVIIPVYEKQMKVNYQKIKREINPTWNKSGLDSCSRVSLAILEKLSKEDADFNLKESTVYFYTRKGRNELYGKPFCGGGELGKCEYVWCKKMKDGSYEFLTMQEQEIRDKLIKKYFGNTTEKQLIVKQMVQDGELKTEEAFEYLNKITGMTDNNFVAFLKELQQAIGAKVVKGTLVEWSAY